MYLDTLKEKTLMRIGSATTLVAQKILDETDCCPELALFLSTPISLDTYNFSDKLVQFDIEKQIFARLQDLCPELKADPSGYWKKMMA